MKEAELRVAGISVNRLKSTTLQEFIDVYIEALNPFFRKTIDENTYLEDFCFIKRVPKHLFRLFKTGCAKSGLLWRKYG